MPSFSVTLELPDIDAEDYASAVRVFIDDTLRYGHTFGYRIEDNESGRVVTYDAERDHATPNVEP